MFVPDSCALRPFNVSIFDARFAGGRRLIMLGDSLMRLNFYSLACLARSQIREGNATSWAHSNITWQGTTPSAGRRATPPTSRSSLLGTSTWRPAERQASILAHLLLWACMQAVILQ